MKTEKIVLAKDELETAKLNLIKAWLKRYFKGKRKKDSHEIWFAFTQFLDQLHDSYFDKIFVNPEFYNFVSKVEDEYEESFELNPRIDNVKILTRTTPSGFFVQRPQYKGGSNPHSSSETTKPQEPCRGGSCTRPQSGSSTRPASETTEMAETLIDHWIQELERIPPTYIDLENEDFEI